MKKKTIKILLDHRKNRTDNSCDYRPILVEKDIDDLFTFQDIDELKSKLTFCDVLDKKQLLRVKRFIKELQNREVINTQFVLEYYKTITYMINKYDDYNILNRSSVLVIIYSLIREKGNDLQYFCLSK